jgi:transposase InsO family protein
MSKKRNYTIYQPTAAQERALIKAYYTDGYTLGRDALYYLLRQRMPVNHPTKHEINNFLKKQTVHKRSLIPKIPKIVSGFKTIKPFNSFSIDLIDFSNKTVNNHNYILNIIDNFSRYMWCAPLVNKTPEDVVKALKPILESIENKYGKLPKYIVSDRGSEFEKDYLELLTDKGIRTHKTIAGLPQSNGMIERSNLSLKQIMNRHKLIEQKKGLFPNWFTLLDKATKVYNNSYHGSIKMTPAQAIGITDDNILKDMRADQKKERIINKKQPVNYKVGDSVRLRVLKNKLSKYTVPNWSSDIYTIERVRPGNVTKATKYVLEDMPNKSWLKESLQLVDEHEQDPPEEYQIQTRATTTANNAPRRSARLQK